MAGLIERARDLRGWEIGLIALTLVCLISGALIKTSQDSIDPNSPITSQRVSPTERDLGKDLAAGATDNSIGAAVIRSARDVPSSLWWAPSDGAALTPNGVSYADGRQLTQSTLSPKQFKEQSEAYLGAIKGAEISKIRVDGRSVKWIKTPAGSLVWIPSDRALINLSGDWSASEVKSLEEGRG